MTINKMQCLIMSGCVLDIDCMLGTWLRRYAWCMLACWNPIFLHIPMLNGSSEDCVTTKMSNWTSRRASIKGSFVKKNA